MMLCLCYVEASGLRPKRTAISFGYFPGIYSKSRSLSVKFFQGKFDFCTMPEKVNEIFRSVVAESAVWVLFDANFC